MLERGSCSEFVGAKGCERGSQLWCGLCGGGVGVGTTGTPGDVERYQQRDAKAIVSSWGLQEDEAVTHSGAFSAQVKKRQGRAPQ